MSDPPWCLLEDFYTHLPQKKKKIIIDVDFHRKKLGAVQQRCTLRITCSYRTVSEAAVLVIERVMPIRLMAKQRKLVYDNKDRIGKVNATKEARDIVLDAWQHD